MKNKNHTILYFILLVFFYTHSHAQIKDSTSFLSDFKKFKSTKDTANMAIIYHTLDSLNRENEKEKIIKQFQLFNILNQIESKNLPSLKYDTSGIVVPKASGCFDLKCTDIINPYAIQMYTGKSIEKAYPEFNKLQNEGKDLKIVNYYDSWIKKENGYFYSPRENSTYNFEKGGPGLNMPPMIIPTANQSTTIMDISEGIKQPVFPVIDPSDDDMYYKLIGDEYDTKIQLMLYRYHCANPNICRYYQSYDKSLKSWKEKAISRKAFIEYIKTKCTAQ